MLKVFRCGSGAGALSPKVRTEDQPNQASSPKIQNVEKAPTESTKSAETSIPQTLKVSDTSEVLSAVKQLNVSRSVPVGILSLSRPVSTDAPVGGPYTRPAHPARGGKGCCWDRNKSYMVSTWFIAYSIIKCVSLIEIKQLPGLSINLNLAWNRIVIPSSCYILAGGGDSRKSNHFVQFKSLRIE